MSTANQASALNGATAATVDWPAKVDLFGVHYSPTTYDEATDAVLAAAVQNQPGIVSCHAVHAVITSSGDPELRAKVNSFDMVTPDGQPVRWALNLLHHSRLSDRVYGPELMMRVCQRAAEADVPVYLYGGSDSVIRKLRQRLSSQFSDLHIAGCEAPPFRELTPQEDRAVIERVNASGAGIMFIGLGCPKQDEFAFAHRRSIRAVQVCVGAAFDFHAGVKSMAPQWMQRVGLEWLFRLMQEPGRLWRRYLVTNSVFVAKLLTAMLPGRVRRTAERFPDEHDC